MGDERFILFQRQGLVFTVDRGPIHGSNAMTKAERAKLIRIKHARIAALRGLGYTGRIPRERFLATGALVYEKTAAQLIGVSRRRLRELVEPVEWVMNPVYRSTPAVPVYDPRALLRTRHALDKNPELKRPAIARARRETDEEIAREYRKFIERGREHSQYLRDRAAERWEEREYEQTTVDQVLCKGHPRPVRISDAARLRREADELAGLPGDESAAPPGPSSPDIDIER
jgi:hypothetical protein